MIEINSDSHHVTTQDGSFLELSKSFEIGNTPLYLYKVLESHNEELIHFDTMAYTKFGKPFLSEPDSTFAHKITIVTINAEVKDVNREVKIASDTYMAQFYDEDLDSGQGTYLSDGVYVRSDGSLYDSKG